MKVDKKGNRDMRILISVKLLPHVIKEIDAQAEKEHRSRNNMIEFVLIKYIVNSSSFKNKRNVQKL